MDAVLEGIQKGSAELKPTETVDKSAPATEGAHVKQVDRSGFLNEVQKGAELQRATESSDRSAPATAGASVQQVDRTAQMQGIKHGSVMHEIKAGQDIAELKHVETVDKSTPATEGAHVKQVDRSGFLNEVQKGAELQHSADPSDRSAPVISADVKVKANPRPALLEEVKAKGHNE